MRHIYLFACVCLSVDVGTFMCALCWYVSPHHVSTLYLHLSRLCFCLCVCVALFGVPMYVATTVCVCVFP